MEYFQRGLVSALEKVSLGILAHRTSEDERLGCPITSGKYLGSMVHHSQNKVSQDPFRPFGRGTTLLGGLTNHGY